MGVVVLDPAWLGFWEVGVQAFILTLLSSLEVSVISNT